MHYPLIKVYVNPSGIYSYTVKSLRIEVIFIEDIVHIAVGICRRVLLNGAESRGHKGITSEHSPFGTLFLEGIPAVL